MRARLALLVSETAFELREVKLSAKPPEMIALSPKGTVPVLVLPDGRVIDQSLDIMRWALGRNDPESWLDGDDPALIEANDGPFKHHLDRYKYPHRRGAIRRSIAPRRRPCSLHWTIGCRGTLICVGRRDRSPMRR